MRSLGGEIHVESEKGSGTTFRVVLPAAASVATTQRPSKPSAVVPTSRPRVLVVDDEPAVRGTMRRLLMLAFDVELCESGNAALARLAKEHFDVILCDLMMPDGTGIDVFEALSANAPDVAQRLVFMTGGAFAPEARALVERASLPVLAKPVDVTELRRVIAEVAARKS